jgi:hypothetical protein
MQHRRKALEPSFAARASAARRPKLRARLLCDGDRGRTQVENSLTSG